MKVLTDSWWLKIKRAIFKAKIKTDHEKKNRNNKKLKREKNPYQIKINKIKKFNPQNKKNLNITLDIEGLRKLNSF